MAQVNGMLQDAKDKPFPSRCPAPRVESRTGALTIGSGGYSVAFASGLSPAPLSRFRSPLSEPDVRFSRISALQWDHASRTQVPARIRGRLLWDWHPSPTPSTSARGLPPGLLTPRRRRPHQTTPSLWHVMLPESPVLLPGFQAFATPETLPPSVTAPHLRPLPSTGITRLLRYYEPLRHPVGPDCPSRGPGSVRASPPTGLPVLPPSSPSMRASVTTPAGPERCPRRSLPSSAFPISQVGRPPHRPFRGLLDVHSRSGPHVR